MSKEEIKEKITEAVKSSPYRDYIQSISLFGSFLHGNQKKDSDVDLLINLKSSIGFFELFDIQQDLEKKLGRKVDLATPGGLNKYIKNDVLSEAKKVYDTKVSV
jgi:predicted nucleotidyltransferase